MKVRGWKKIFHANRDDKKVGVAILISDKRDFNLQMIKREKEGHYIMIKESIHQEDKLIVNIYLPNIWAPKNIKQKLTELKGEINKTVIVGDFNTPL